MKKITSILLSVIMSLLFVGTVTYAKIYNPTATNNTTVTADNFVATGTTATSTFLGMLTVGTTTDSAVITIGQPNDSDGLRMYGWDDRANYYSDLYINEFGNLISTGAYGLMNFKNNLKIDDDKELIIGGNADFSIVYSNLQDTLQFNIGNSSDVGTVLAITPTSKVGIGTTSPATLLDVFSTATTTIKIDSNSVTQGGCLKMKDIDGVGYSYGTSLAGVITWSTVSCE